MITKTFGGMLYSPGTECLSEFPSPESLKRRIIISTKPPKEYLQAKDSKIQETTSKKRKDASKQEPWGKEIHSFGTKSNVNKVSYLSWITLSIFTLAYILSYTTISIQGWLLRYRVQ